jgi:hypothetical protein
MPIYFFDTCALVPRYEPGTYSRRVRALTAARSGVKIAIADFSVVETISAFAKICRANRLGKITFERWREQFEDDLAARRILVRPVTQSDMRRAIHLIAYAGVVKGNNIRTVDAMIGASARELALISKERVILYTNDWGLYHTLYGLRAYTSVLILRHLGPGRGTTPNRTG